MELQTETKIVEQSEGFAKIAIEPLKQGFGHTLGNALRRVLLSSLTGAAITSVKIIGVSHEFSTIAGMKEDMVEFILNLKKITFKMEQPKPVITTLSVQGPKELTAADLKCPTGLEVVNKDLYLATLADKKSKLECEITVDYGRGYRLPPEEEGAVGVILLDANFSPVNRVNYKVESTRVGRVTNLDRLIFEIWTNQSVEPLEVLKQVAAILVEEFEKIKGGTPVIRLEEDEKKPASTDSVPAPKVKVYLEELGLSTRTVNSLKKGGVETVEDVKKTGEEGLSKVKNVGPKTIKLVLDKVRQHEKKSK